MPQGHEVLRAVVEEQRANARAEDRSARLFLEAIHAEYAMPGSRDRFVRSFRRYPIEDLQEADECFLRVYDGPTGSVLYSNSWSITLPSVSGVAGIPRFVPR